MKITKTKLSLLACALLGSSNLYGGGPTDYVKDMRVGIGNSPAGQFTRTNSSYTTQSDFASITDPESSYYFNENSFFTILYADTYNFGDAMVGKLFYALTIERPGSIAYGNIGIDINSTNKAQALSYFKNNVEIKDNSALLDFEYFAINSNATTEIIMKAIQAQSVGSTISANNTNAQAAAGTLQTIVDNSGSYSQMNGVITALNGLSTNAQVAKAVDSTTPQTTTSSFTASNQISNNVSNIVTQRQTITMNGATGANSGDELLASKNMWVKPYGSYGSQENKNGVNGFDISTYGIGIGVDGETKNNQQMGLGFFYTKADVDVNNVSQTSDIDVYSLVIYGSAPIVDDKTNVLYQVGYSYQDTSSQRDIAFMSTSAKADYDSHVASVDVRVLRDYPINDKVLLQPLVSTTYRYFKTANYSESGAGSLNLNVKDFSSSEFILGLGTLAYYQINNESKLFGNVNVGYDLKDDNTIVTSSYQGASGLSFETEGIDNGRWTYDLGFGYENDLTELSNLSFTYNFQGEGSDYTNHVISAKYTFKF